MLGQSHITAMNILPHTQRAIVIAFYRHVLLDFYVVDILQNCQSMANTRNSHLLQIIMLQRDQCLPHDLVFCVGSACGP
jgi:hypothetical protein